MKLPTLQGSPKQVTWASRIREERLRVWRESSPELLAAIASSLESMADAGWWISYREKELAVVSAHLLQGVDLQKIQKEEWRNREKQQEQKESAATRSYLKKELEKEAKGKSGQSRLSPVPSLTGSRGGELLKWEGAARDMITGELSTDPDLPF